MFGSVKSQRIMGTPQDSVLDCLGALHSEDFITPVLYRYTLEQSLPGLITFARLLQYQEILSN